MITTAMPTLYRFIFGRCEKCGRTSHTLSRGATVRDDEPWLACATCREKFGFRWMLDKDWHAGIVAERPQEPLDWEEWKRANPPLDEFTDDDEPEVDVCRNGHPWTPENTRHNRNGSRVCRECHRMRERQRIRGRTVRNES
jgi:hypothetical protein